MASGVPALLALVTLTACSGASREITDATVGTDAAPDSAVGTDASNDATNTADASPLSDAAADATHTFDGSTDAASIPEGGADAGGPARRVYSGTLDASGNATIAAPEISLATMPLVLGYVFSGAYAVPGFVLLGNIVPGDGTFRFAAGALNANADYRLVIVDSDHVETGTLDASGNATISVPEISVANIPLVMGYVFSNAYAEPGYVAVGNIVPGDGVFRFAAGAGNANAPFILVLAAPAGHETGVLDSTGNATAAIADIAISGMPAVLGYVFSSAYAEPGYVQLGNITPGDGTFRLAAGAGNGSAPFVITWSN